VYVRAGFSRSSRGGQGLYHVRKQIIGTLSIEDGLSSSNIFPIFQNRTGAIWFGTWGGGVARYAEGRITTFSGKDGLTSGVITAIYMDHQGVLWVGTEAGQLFRMRNRRFDQVHPPLLSEHTVVRAIHEGSEDSLWFGTDQGLLWLKHGVRRLGTTKTAWPRTCVFSSDLSGQQRGAITLSRSLADDARSNFGRLRQSQKCPLPACRVVRAHLYTAIGWHSVPPREEAIQALLSWPVSIGAARGHVEVGKAVSLHPFG